MKLQLVAIYDKRSKEYSPPHVYVTLGVAEREFADAINDDNSKLNKHPGDYNMQHLGEFDSETGNVTMNAQGPHIFAEASQLHQERN